MPRTRISLTHLTKTQKILLGILAFLLVIRIALPFAIEGYANHRLAQMKDYRGHIGDVDLALLQGSYQVEEVRLVKTGGKVPVPFFSAPEIKLSVEWKALLQGEVAAEVKLKRPKINFVDGPTPRESQKEISSDWRDAVDDLIPIQLNRLTVREGEIHFRNLKSDPPVDVHLKSLDVDALNLSNIRKEKQALPSTVHARGLVMNEAPFQLRLGLNALREPIDFDLNSELKNLPLPKLNDFFRAYANVDIEEGTLSLATELAAKNGKLEGYIKPVLKNLNVVQLEEDAPKGAFALLWQSFTGVVGDLMQNEDKQAAKIPIEGSLKDPNVKALAAIGSAFSHAFGDPLSPEVEGTVNLESAAAGQEAEAEDEKKEEQKEEQQK